MQKVTMMSAFLPSLLMPFLRLQSIKRLSLLQEKLWIEPFSGKNLIVYDEIFFDKDLEALVMWVKANPGPGNLPATLVAGKPGIIKAINTLLFNLKVFLIKWLNIFFTNPTLNHFDLSLLFFQKLQT